MKTKYISALGIIVTVLCIGSVAVTNNIENSAKEQIDLLLSQEPFKNCKIRLMCRSEKYDIQIN